MAATIFRGGEDRVLAALPRPADLAPGKLAGAPLFADKFKVYSRDELIAVAMTDDDEIRAFIYRRIAYGLTATDQNGEGACGGFSACMLLQEAISEQGQQCPALAGGRVYHLSGGGRDGGSYLSDNLSVLLTHGAPLWKSRKQELDYRSQWSAEESAEAAKWKLAASADCPDWLSVASCVAAVGPVQHGIDVGRDYDVDDSGLWIADQVGSGGGHAQCTPLGGLCFSKKKNKLGLIVRGSWSAKFGYHGYYVVPESYFNRSGYGDNWAGLYSAAVKGDVGPKAKA